MAVVLGEGVYDFSLSYDIISARIQTWCKINAIYKGENITTTYDAVHGIGICIYTHARGVYL